jgi:hypothetical protein
VPLAAHLPFTMKTVGTGTSLLHLLLAWRVVLWSAGNAVSCRATCTHCQLRPALICSALGEVTETPVFLNFQLPKADGSGQAEMRCRSAPCVQQAEPPTYQTSMKGSSGGTDLRPLHTSAIN